MFLYTTGILIGCIVVLVKGYNNSTHTKESEKIEETLGDNIITVIVGIVSFVGLGSLLSLSVFHTYLILIGETTNESLRGVYKSISNPFNRGCIGNCFNIFCVPVIKSRIGNNNINIINIILLSLFITR